MVVRVLGPEVKVLRKRILLGAGVAIAMSFSWADAQTQWFVMPSGPGALYFGIEGGWTALTDNVSDRVGSVKLTEHLSDGFNVGARAGYEWGPIRFEEEFSFANNHATRLAALGGSIPVTGERNRYALMTNAIYDFPLDRKSTRLNSSHRCISYAVFCLK